MFLIATLSCQHFLNGKVSCCAKLGFKVPSETHSLQVVPNQPGMISDTPLKEQYKVLRVTAFGERHEGLVSQSLLSFACCGAWACTSCHSNWNQLNVELKRH